MRQPTGRLRIRLAQANEVDALSQLSIRAKQSNGYDDKFMAMCRDELTISAADLNRAEYWVAEMDSICGLIALSASSNCSAEAPTTGPQTTGEIEAFFVEPHWQGQGVGRLLWQFVCQRAAARGVARLHLDSDPSAVPFYEAMGLKQTGSVPSISIPGRMLPTMSIDIG